MTLPDISESSEMLLIADVSRMAPISANMSGAKKWREMFGVLVLFHNSHATYFYATSTALSIGKCK